MTAGSFSHLFSLDYGSWGYYNTYIILFLLHEFLIIVMSTAVNISEPLNRNRGHGREGSLTQGPPDRQTATEVTDQRGACTPNSISFESAP